MKFSRNPVTGQMEIYTDEGVYVGIMSTFGDSFLQEGKEQSAEDGGPGSGNWGHRGRPGKRGGSGPGGGSQYRGGRSDVGYFSSRGDWLNGLSGEKQHEAIRHIAATKKVMQSRIEAMKAIKAMEIPEDQKAELLKRGKLDKVREDMTPEEFKAEILKELEEEAIGGHMGDESDEMIIERYDAPSTDTSENPSNSNN